MSKGTEDKARCRAAVEEAIGDARHNLDIRRVDTTPDALKWIALEQQFAELLFAAYARNHTLSRN